MALDIDYQGAITLACMAKAMRYQELARALRDQGCSQRPGKGDHEKWTCPCGRHMTVVTRPGMVSPGLVRQAVQRLECLPKGWLQ